MKNRYRGSSHTVGNRRPDDYQRNESHGMNERYRTDDYYSAPGRSGGYDNRDYDERNFWDYDNGYGFGRSSNREFIPSRSERNSYDRSQGYGSRDSRFINEFDSWRNGNGEQTGDQGYRGRNSSDYNNDGDRRNDYYNPADFNRDGRRRNPEADNYNQFAGPYYRNRENHYDYDYYQSYPSYGQGAPYNDHERGYIDKQEARGNRGIDNEDDYGFYRRENSGYGRRHSEYESDRRYRPNTRNKRY